MKSTPNQHKIKEIDAKAQENQRNRFQIQQKSTKPTPDHKRINEIDAKSQKNQ